MTDILQRLQSVDWTTVQENISNTGYALISSLLDHTTCNELIQQYDNELLYRKRIVMERYRFGLGEYKYFQYPLPNLIQQLRETIYPCLVPVANNWMKVLQLDKHYPSTLKELHQFCRENKQDKPTVLILKYGKDGHNTLHQDLYGEVFFPMQALLFLDEPGVDYTGGEFVLVQQTPRAQSKAMVLQPRKGDLLLFTTNFRPVKGSKGYYRVNMKHGVSALHSGTRHTLGIIFHDAES
ncbi:MAG: 2OG-Fe(II) oxygenase [Chitinophagaceae bacterium]